MTNTTPSSPGGGNDGGKPVSFNKGDAMRIAAAVQKVERGDRKMGPSKLPRAAGGGGSAGGLFRMVITQDTLTCGGLVTGVKIFWTGSAWQYDDEAFTILDSLYLISSEYHVGDKLWCSHMDDTGYMEVVMPASECSCVGASRTKLAGMIFGDLEEATQTGVQVLVLQDGCIMRMHTERCLTE
jgi:hypothetical protein